MKELNYFEERMIVGWVVTMQVWAPILMVNKDAGHSVYVKTSFLLFLKHRVPEEYKLRCRY